MLTLVALAGCADAHESNANDDAATMLDEGDASSSHTARRLDAGGADATASSATPEPAVSPFAALSCVELLLAAEARVSDWVAAADNACSTHADCVLRVPRASCPWSCTDAFVSMHGAASLGALIAELEGGLCAESARRCAPRERVPCDQSFLEPRCEQGACSARRIGCPDNPRAFEDLPCSEPGKVCYGPGSDPFGIVCLLAAPGEYRWREYILL